MVYEVVRDLLAAGNVGLNDLEDGMPNSVDRLGLVDLVGLVGRREHSEVGRVQATGARL
ncbi:hypothetical protein AB0B10_15405 [Micromonospora arborensis]|uniref:hypothetical protein n=1 Tax=Micromonospora arborensis TaxID=2116518 RepID=UPI0033E514C5